MKRAPSRGAKRPAAKPRKRAAPVALPAATTTPVVVGAPAPAPTIEDLARRVVTGGELGAAERERIGEALFEATPTRLVEPAEPEEGEPADVACGSQRALAEACGVHVNTITNWKNAGIAPLGDAPFSLKAYFLLLRRKNRLGECKPTAKPAHALWRWCFGANAGAAINPDDPVHQPPESWSGERERQAALGALTARRKLQVEFETLSGERMPAEEVRQRLRALADDVRSVLGGFLGVVAKVNGLTPDQRADLSDAIQAQIAAAQQELTQVRGRQ